MTRRILVRFAALSVLIGQPAAFGETLQDALRLAYTTNPQIESERKGAEIAQEQLNQATAQRRPSVTLSGNAGMEDVGTNRQFNFGVGTRPTAAAQLETRLPIYTGGRISAGVKQARAGIDAADAQLLSATQDLTLDVITAYVDVLRDRETIAIRENSVNLLTEQVRAATDRFDVGDVTRTDVALTEARLEGALASLAGAQAGLEGSEAVYSFVVGQEAGALAPVPPAPEIPATFEEALSLAFANNPDLDALRASERAASEAVRVAKGAKKPSVALVGQAAIQQQFDTNEQDTSVSALAEASIPLYQGGQVDADTRAAKLQLEQARLQTRLASRQIRSQLAQAWYGLIATNRAITASERQVEAAEIAYEGAQEELAVGVRTTLDVLDQEQELLEARLGLVNAKRDAYVATHQLLRAMGRLSEETLASGSAAP